MVQRNTVYCRFMPSERPYRFTGFNIPNLGRSVLVSGYHVRGILAKRNSPNIPGRGQFFDFLTGFNIPNMDRFSPTSSGEQLAIWSEMNIVDCASVTG